MVYAHELDFWLSRYNDPARMRMYSAALMAAVAWVVAPLVVLLPVALIVSFVCMMGTGSFDGGLKIVMSREFLAGFGLIYLAPNLLILSKSLFFRSDHSYEGDSFSFFSRIFLWPGHMTAEAINQKRVQWGLTPAQRAQAQVLMLQLHLAGPQGLAHVPADASETELIQKLVEINAIRANEGGLVSRLWRREPDASLAIPTTLDRADLPPIGLIAGGGHLPLLQAVGMHQAGRRVVGVGLTGQYDPAFPDFCDAFVEVSPLRPNAWARQLRARDVCEAVMVGHVQKTNMQNPMDVLRHCPDLAALRLWFGRHDHRSQGLLYALAEHLKHKGLLLVSTTQYIPDHVASLGTMSRRAPTQDQLRDIKMALSVLLELNKLDIGQGLCVKGGDIIALEAMEGTDRMIARAGELCPRGGWTLVKGADSRKDLRFDVPTVGLHTIENLKKAGAGCLAVAADRTIFVNKPEVIAAADRAGLVVVGFELK